MDTIIEIATVAARLLVGAVLLAAGCAKLRRSSDRFLDTVVAFDLLPRAAARAVAFSLPRVEVLLGGALLLGLAIPFAAGGAFVLVLALTAAVITSLARRRRHLCGCLGFTRDQVREVQWSLVGRNLGLLVALMWPASFADAMRVDAWLSTGFGLSISADVRVLMISAVIATALASLAIRARLSSVSPQPGEPT